MVNQGQTQQQDMQLRGMEIQQRAQDLQDQQVMRQAYMDAQGDPQKFQQLVVSRGASPKAIMQLNQQMVQMRENAAKMSEAELKVNAAKNDRLQGLFQPAIDAKPEDAGPIWSNAWQQAQKEGLVDPVKHPIPMDYPGQVQAKMLGYTLNTGSSLIDEASKKTATAKNQADLTKAQMANTAQVLSTAPDQETWDNAFANFRAQNYPDTVLNQFPKTWSPENAKQAAYIGMTPEQRTVAQENEQKSEQLKIGKIASQLANNPQAYGSILGDLPSKYANLFPKQFTDRESILAIGATPAEQLMASHRTALETHAENMEAVANRRADIAQQNADRMQNRTDQTERNGDQRQIRKNQFDQNKLNQLRRQLGTALGGLSYDENGNVTAGTFIDDKGAPHQIGAMRAAATQRGDDPNEVANEAVADAVARYQSHTENLKNNIAETNDLYNKWGAEPGVSTEKAHAALDAGDAKLFSDMEARKSGKPVQKGTRATGTTIPNTLAPGETPSPSGVPSTGTFVPRNQPTAAPPAQQKFTEAQVRTRARAAGIDPDAAVARARQNKLIQ
jgi:hypothetical protein